MTNTRIPLGKLVITPRAKDAIPRAEVLGALLRHQTGDFGDDLYDDDWDANVEALETGDRILSAYNASNGIRFWIITEGDRSSTTILLPEDY